MNNRVATIESASAIVGRASDGRELHGVVQSIGRYSAVLVFYGPEVVIRVSEVLDPLQISMRGREVYHGRAVVASVQSMASSVACEVSLEERFFTAAAPVAPGSDDMPSRYREFSEWWQKSYRVRTDYKVAIADLETYLLDLRLWMDVLDMEIEAEPADRRPARRAEILGTLSRQSIPLMTELFERCERVSVGLEGSEVAAHRSFARRRIHPLVLCAPFCHRTYFKPLGYAGDFEMVNMILRDPREGRSSYAQLVNSWFLAQAPAEAHRRRLDYLEARLQEEAIRCWIGRRPLRVLNLGCGPCIEIQRFLRGWEKSEGLEFTLVDFNEETLVAARNSIGGALRPGRHPARLEYVRKSVMQILAGGARSGGMFAEGGYDFVYCAGLTDYLTDAVCRRLMEQLYQCVAPGGLMVVTNVDKSNPRIETMEQILDWHLVYRTGGELEALAPVASGLATRRVLSDPTGVNDYLEVRRAARV